jgi:hypothetical protein
LFILFSLSSAFSFAQAPTWLWAKSAGGTGYDYGKSNSIDGNGNVYVLGNFTSSKLIIGSDTLLNTDTSGNTQDIVIVKYDIDGNLIWAKNFGGSSDDAGTRIFSDSSGSFFITGSFKSTNIIFGGDTLINANADSADFFVGKYNNAGNEVWAKCAGGIINDVGCDITLDAIGNVYVVGIFSDSTITFDGTTLTNTNTGSNDIFIVKYDNNGNVLWSKSAGSSSWDYANGIAVDSN